MGILNFIRPTPLKFEQKHKITDTVYSFTFTTEKPLVWHAGQHGLLEVKLPSGKTSRRMFSLSSAPSENKITITTYWRGESASDYKRALWKLKLGDSVKLRGPVGPMHIRDTSVHHILLAGGIGITPFRSMLIDAELTGRSIHATLLYVNKNEQEVIFKNELNLVSKHLKDVKINYLYHPEKITSETIKNSAGNEINSGTRYYLSGPPKMIKEYKQLLRQLGVPKKYMYSDPFIGYK